MNIAYLLESEKIVPYRNRIGIFTVLLGAVILMMAMIALNPNNISFSSMRQLQEAKF